MWLTELTLINQLGIGVLFNDLVMESVCALSLKGCILQRLFAVLKSFSTSAQQKRLIRNGF